MERDVLERMLADGLSVAAIGRQAGLHESTVAYWMAKHGLRAHGAGKHAARGPLARETLEGLVERGLSIAQIAAEVDRSKATVRHWLLRYELKTAEQKRRVDACSAPQGGRPDLVIRVCQRHGRTEFLLESRGYYRCRRCRLERVSRRRRRVKEILVGEAGGACTVCGYSRCVAALHFHHVDPATKRFHLSMQGAARSLEASRAEMAKCVLLCANCHAEVEQGITRLPANKLPAA